MSATPRKIFVGSELWHDDPEYGEPRLCVILDYDDATRSAYVEYESTACAWVSYDELEEDWPHA